MIGLWTNRLHRWGFILVSRIVGTQAATHVPTQQHREVITQMLMMRAELNALVQVIAKTDPKFGARFSQQLEVEAKILCEAYEKKFPGARAGEDGIIIYDPKLFAETAKDWPQ